MEISYGIEYLYQTIGKLHVEGEVYKQRINLLEQQLKTALPRVPTGPAGGGVDSPGAVPSDVPHQASPDDQDGAESSTVEGRPDASA